MSSRTISELKAKFHDLNTNQQEKIQILTLLSSNLSVSNTRKYMNTSNYYVKIARDLHTESGIMSLPPKRLGKYSKLYFLKLVRIRTKLFRLSDIFMSEFFMNTKI